MRPVNVLLVDDNPSNLASLFAILADLGQNLVRAHSGEEALRYVLENDFAVILLDVHMQGMDGFETAQLIRARPKSQHIPIIFITGVENREMKIFEGYKLGAVDYLIKPIEPDILRAKVSVFVELCHRTHRLERQLQKNKRLNRAIRKEKRSTAEHRKLLADEQTARVQAEEMQKRLAFLANASEVLVSSLDYETTLRNLAQLAVPTIADWCAVDMVQEDGTLNPLAVMHIDPAKVAAAQELQRRFPPDPNAPYGAYQVLRTGQPEFYPEVPDAALAAAARNAEELQLMRQVSGTSVMIVPLNARDRTLGTLTFALTQPERRYTIEDLTLAQDLARRAALAVDNTRLYKEAQQAIQARDEFLSVAAHELRTPITSLRGFAQMTLRQMRVQESLDPDRIERALETIEQQSEKLTGLVAQLLDVSRIEAGRLEVECRDMNLVDVVQRVIQTVHSNSPDWPITLKSPLEVIVCIDALRMEQVLINLIDNAMKYSPANKPIEVEIRVANRTTSLSVTDQGIGIPPEYQERVFDRFFRAHVNSGLDGLGLGLYIAQQIVELHQGKISVESPTEGGTRFVIELPLSSSHKEESQPLG